MNIDEIIHELNMHEPKTEGEIRLVILIIRMAYHIGSIQADVERLKNLQEAKLCPGYGINWPKEQGEGR
jgi:hypothetical protein